jgi:hypothetical protein
VSLVLNNAGSKFTGGKRQWMIGIFREGLKMQRLFAFVLVIGALIINCKSPTESAPGNTGYYEVDGKKYPLLNFHMDAHVTKPTDTLKEFILSFSEKQYDQADAGSDVFLALNLFSSNLPYLEPGIYRQRIPADTVSFSVAFGYLNAYSTLFDRNIFYSIESSQITVTRSGNIYTFDITGVLENFKEFKAYYKGTFDSF